MIWTSREGLLEEVPLLTFVVDDAEIKVYTLILCNYTINYDAFKDVCVYLWFDLGHYS